RDRTEWRLRDKKCPTWRLYGRSLAGSSGNAATEGDCHPKRNHRSQFCFQRRIVRDQSEGSAASRMFLNSMHRLLKNRTARISRKKTAGGLVSVPSVRHK